MRYSVRVVSIRVVSMLLVSIAGGGDYFGIRRPVSPPAKRARGLDTSTSTMSSYNFETPCRASRAALLTQTLPVRIRSHQQSLSLSLGPSRRLGVRDLVYNERPGPRGGAAVKGVLSLHSLLRMHMRRKRVL
ncbi:hypothetical protein V8C37DRAFT_233975 [Trichoderma ceciliae]